MSIHYRPTVAEIDLNALRHNVREVKKRLPAGVAVMAIVKANAYGHGAVFCSRVLKGTGVESLGVATLEEGIELRENRLTGDIIVLGGLLSDSLNEFLEYRLKPVIHQLEDVERFGRFLAEKDKNWPVHLKIDTGMGRLGIFPSQTDELFSLLKKNRCLSVEGVLTHLARADEEDTDATNRQFVLFDKLKKIFSDRGVNVPVYHIANSAAIIDGKFGADYFNQPQRGVEGEAPIRLGRLEGALPAPLIVRPGIMLYGAYPHFRQREKIELKPVMTFKTKIINLKKHPPGSAVSYGGTFVTDRESLIAIIPVGYADGYPRLLSNRGFVLVGGRRCPVVGRVCMDLTMVDVTDSPQAKLGDEAVMIGQQGSERIRAEEVAEWAETISYEIFCGVSSRVPRVYLGL